jgi:hypothetical protein
VQLVSTLCVSFPLFRGLLPLIAGMKEEGFEANSRIGSKSVPQLVYRQLK